MALNLLFPRGVPLAIALVAAAGCASKEPSIVDPGAAGDGSPPGACGTMPTPTAFVRGAHPLAQDELLRVNHLQAKATHNSYHIAPNHPLDEWDYTHVPLAQQLDSQGVRGVELDVQWDAECGRFRVFHILALDALTTCEFFTDCLVALRGWSFMHPGHHPIFVQIEPKFGSSSDDVARLAELDKEILAVFEKPWLIVPDDIKGASSSVSAGLAERGWPTLGAARGRFVFYLNDGSGIRDAYTHQRHDLDGRLLFAEGNLDEPFVAIQVINDPIADHDAIAAALVTGRIVRTRADSSPSQAKAGDTASRTAAFASGAQIISTDFPAPVAGVAYVVTVPGGTPSRCAPQVAPPTCTSLDIEDPSKLLR